MPRISAAADFAAISEKSSRRRVLELEASAHAIFRLRHRRPRPWPSSRPSSSSPRQRQRPVNALSPTSLPTPPPEREPARSVAFWPTGAAPSRHVVRVGEDDDLVAFSLSRPGLRNACLHFARTGRRVHALKLLENPLPPSTAPSTTTTTTTLARRRRRTKQVEAELTHAVVFAPEAGPGDYELYSDCPAADADAPRHASASVPSRRRGRCRRRSCASRSARRSAAVARALRARRRGARQRALGNVRARIYVPTAAAGSRGALPRPVRRRGWPSETALYLYREPPGARAERGGARRVARGGRPPLRAALRRRRVPALLLTVRHPLADLRRSR